MITFKCLYKLTKEEVQGIVFDIKNGKNLKIIDEKNNCFWNDIVYDL